MSRKFLVWLDSGANVSSVYSTTVTLEDMGITPAEWDAMSHEERDAALREVAFSVSEWGWEEIFWHGEEEA